ncbi:MAG TPA: HdeD family acid-resistance protein [Chloroflexota bacterium]|nr:HdeD family acid-resistance protein [Chloroflexota bacterium]
MLKLFSRNWWVLALRGAFAVLFGVLAFALPGITLGALVLLFGAYAFVDGVLAIYHAFAGDAGSRWVLALEGIVGVLAGIGTLVYPGITAVALLYVISAWAVLTGVLEIAAAIELRKVIDGEWMLALGGIASIVFGVLLAVQPAAGLLTVVWIIGAYAVVFGVALIALGFKVRSIGQPTAAHSAT